jgi:hypothetical protein
LYFIYFTNLVRFDTPGSLYYTNDVQRRHSMTVKTLPQKARKKAEALLAAHGVDDYTWIDPRRIITAQWVRMKCMYGCASYGRKACCPPNTPTVAECERFLKE